MKQDADNLLPCDRCGKTNVKFYAHSIDENEHWWHFNHYCNAIYGDIHSGMFDTKQGAIDAWNYRADKDTQ